MDPDGEKKNTIVKRQEKEINFIQRYLTNVSNVLPSFWIRRIIQTDNGFNWFILGSRYSFLLYFRLFLVILYLAYEVFK